MSNWKVNIVEMDDFGSYLRLEESFEFPTEELAKAFQAQYNKQNNAGLIEGNLLVARRPFEVKESKNAD